MKVLSFPSAKSDYTNTYFKRKYIRNRTAWQLWVLWVCVLFSLFLHEYLSLPIYPSTYSTHHNTPRRHSLLGRIKVIQQTTHRTLIITHIHSHSNTAAYITHASRMYLCTNIVIWISVCAQNYVNWWLDAWQKYHHAISIVDSVVLR